MEPSNATERVAATRRGFLEELGLRRLRVQQPQQHRHKLDRWPLLVIHLQSWQSKYWARTPGEPALSPRWTLLCLSCWPVESRAVARRNNHNLHTILTHSQFHLWLGSTLGQAPVPNGLYERSLHSSRDSHTSRASRSSTVRTISAMAQARSVTPAAARECRRRATSSREFP